MRYYRSDVDVIWQDESWGGRGDMLRGDRMWEGCNDE